MPGYRHRARKRERRASEAETRKRLYVLERQLANAAFARKQAQAADDLLSLERFKTLKAAEYFNIEAARHPGQAEEYARLAEMAAATDPAKLRGAASDYMPEEAPLREWHLARDRHRDGIDRYAACMSREFRNADPARWERLEREVPSPVAGMMPGKPITLHFKIDAFK